MKNKEKNLIKKYIIERANHATHGSSVNGNIINSQSDYGNIRPDLILQNKGLINYSEYYNDSGEIICVLELVLDNLSRADYQNLKKKIKVISKNQDTNVNFKKDIVSIEKKFTNAFEIKQWVSSFIGSINSFFVNT